MVIPDGTSVVARGEDEDESEPAFVGHGCEGDGCYVLTVKQPGLFTGRNGRFFLGGDIGAGGSGTLPEGTWPVILEADGNRMDLNLPPKRATAA